MGMTGMDIMLRVVVGAALLMLLVAGVWRLVSRRHALPCPVWLRWMVELDNPFTRTHRAAIIIEQLGIEPGMAVADVGCGPGRVTIPLAKAVGPTGEVTAMDIQVGMLDRVRTKASTLENIRYLHAGVGSGALESNHYDRLLLVCVLGEIPDREAVFREAFEALRLGGVLSITEVIFDPHFQRQSKVRYFAEKAGFVEQTCLGRRWAYTLHFRKPTDPSRSEIA